MKCDGCGGQFSARDAEMATRNEPVKPAGRMPYTELVTMTLCPECVASRAGTRQFAYWVVGLFVGGTLLIVLANWLWG
jgi:hypothetical protein